MEVRTFQCGMHHLSYDAFNPGCPVCELERDHDRLTAEVRQLRREISYLKGQLDAAYTKTDAVVGYRKAAALLDDDDRAFIKEVLYMARDKSSVSLKPMKEPRTVKGKSRMVAIGFIVHPRQGDAWNYACSSTGGRLLADMFDEASNSMGQSDATKTLFRGLADLLPGKAR